MAVHVKAGIAAEFAGYVRLRFGARGVRNELMMALASSAQAVANSRVAVAG